MIKLHCQNMLSRLKNEKYSPDLVQSLGPHLSIFITLEHWRKVFRKLADLAASIDYTPVVSISFDQQMLIRDKIYQLNKRNSVFTHQA